MTIELITLLTLLFLGATYVHFIGFNSSFLLLPIYFLCGLPIYVVIAYVQACVGNFTSPILTIGIGITLIIILLCYSKNAVLPRNSILCLLFLSVMVGLSVALLRNANLVKFHYDSIEYLINGALLESGNGNSISGRKALMRFSSIPILHAPANVENEFYLPSLAPIIGLSTLGALYWFAITGLRQALSPRESSIFAVAAGVLLLTNNRFIWHSFYINAHLISAAFILVAAGSGWLIALKSASYRQLLGLQAVGIVGIVLSRPEGALFAALAILPTLLSRSIPWGWRAGMLAVLSLSVMLQQVFILSKMRSDVSSSVFELIGLGIGLLILAPILYFKQIERCFKYVIPATEALLWAILILFAFLLPEILNKSLYATFQNAIRGMGGWGVSLTVLASLVAGALLLTRAPHRVFLRFPLTTFLPMSFLLAFLRGHPYRVGVTDTLSRMLIHIVPLAILFVASAAASRVWGWDAVWRPYIGKPHAGRIIRIIEKGSDTPSK